MEELNKRFNNIKIYDCLQVKKYMKNSAFVTKIQSIFRMYLCRKNLIKPTDKFTKAILIIQLNNYKEKILLNNKLNEILSKKKIRNDNFPSEISENIVKFAYCKYKNIMPCWDTKNGDLQILNCKAEIKGFMSSGPSSFGPTETWDIIFFVDGKKYMDDIFIIYMINLKNTDLIWQNIKVNANETYKQQCDMSRRPRIIFKKLYEQIPTIYKKIIFNDHISKL